jgi:hypothetical protein
LATYPIAADNTVFQNTISLLGLKRWNNIPFLIHNNRLWDTYK